MTGFLLFLVVASASLYCANGLAVTKGTIIGGGRIGNLLYELNGKQDQLLSRKSKESIATDGSGPIYVCTRNNDLAKIVEDCPEKRKEDLVFLQNGILTDFLRSKGLEKNTQGLVYFAVSKLGEAPIDGKTDTNPEGLTAVCGKWAEDMSERLRVADLACKVLDEEAFNIAMLEKHIWICAFMAVGSQYEECTVGDVESTHNKEIREVISELAALASYETKVSFPSSPAPLDDRLCAYARSVAHFPTALKEFEWRNGWFAEISMKRASRLLPDISAKHDSILSRNKLKAEEKAKM